MSIFTGCVNTKAKGSIGLGMAIAYFTRMGFTVSIPLNDSQDYDLVVEVDGCLKRVQVKTTDQKIVGKTKIKYTLNLRVLGGNSKRNYIHKMNSDVKYDLLFAVTGDGKSYLIPKNEITSEECIVLGGPKFEKFMLSCN